MKIQELKWIESPSLGGRRKLVALDCFGNQFRRIDLPAHDVDALRSAAQAEYEARIRSALISAPPANAAMREALEEIEVYAKVHGVLVDSDRERLSAVAKTLRKALTAPGATTKSDGTGMEQEDSALSHGESLQQGPDTTTTIGIVGASQRGEHRDGGNVAKPVAASDRASHVAPVSSDPSSTRSEVTVGGLARLINNYTGNDENGYLCARALLDQFEILRK